MVLVWLVIQLDFVMERKRLHRCIGVGLIQQLIGHRILHITRIGESMTKRSILRGNYPLDVEAPKTGNKSDQEAFEEEALKRLGGSTAIIMKGRKLVHEP